MEYLIIQKLLDKNNLTKEKMDTIIKEVSKVNWLLKRILKDTGEHWSELQPYQLQQVVDIYNALQEK